MLSQKVIHKNKKAQFADKAARQFLQLKHEQYKHENISSSHRQNQLKLNCSPILHSKINLNHSTCNTFTNALNLVSKQPKEISDNKSKNMKTLQKKNQFLQSHSPRATLQQKCKKQNTNTSTALMRTPNKEILTERNQNNNKNEAQWFENQQKSNQFINLHHQTKQSIITSAIQKQIDKFKKPLKTTKVNKDHCNSWENNDQLNLSKESFNQKLPAGLFYVPFQKQCLNKQKIDINHHVKNSELKKGDFHNGFEQKMSKNKKYTHKIVNTTDFTKNLSKKQQLLNSSLVYQKYKNYQENQEKQRSIFSPDFQIQLKQKLLSTGLVNLSKTNSSFDQNSFISLRKNQNQSIKISQAFNNKNLSQENRVICIKKSEIKEFDDKQEQKITQNIPIKRQNQKIQRKIQINEKRINEIVDILTKQEQSIFRSALSEYSSLLSLKSILFSSKENKNQLQNINSDQFFHNLDNFEDLISEEDTFYKYKMQLDFMKQHLWRFKQRLSHLKFQLRKNRIYSQEILSSILENVLNVELQLECLPNIQIVKRKSTKPWQILS